jgi:hypothetical protein
MKIRKDRYQYRGVLKENSNQHNTRSAEHPQVYRQLEEEDMQREEIASDETVAPLAPDPPPASSR